MSEMISGIVGQLFQQGLENQALKQQTENSGKRSFESYLQKDKPAQTVETQETQTTSGSDMQKKIAEIQANLTETNKQIKQDSTKINQMIPELLTKDSRSDLLREAFAKSGDTSKVTNNLQGRFEMIEAENNALEAIMRSDKNLSQGELLALQARMYQVGQHIEVMSKVVDQMAGGIKTVLNTNI